MMNSQERDQLSQFLKQLTDVKLSDKNSEAEVMIKEAVARQPDAAYLLVQRSLLLEQALNAAKAKINDMENQLQNAKTASSSNSGFLRNDPWARSSYDNAGPSIDNSQMQAPNGPGNSFFSRATPQSSFSGGASSFLGNVATTAAGVVAGSFLFQGIENLLGHHQSDWGLGHHAQSTDHPVTEQTVINNYFDDEPHHQPSPSEHSNASLADYEVDSLFDDNNSTDSDWI